MKNLKYVILTLCLLCTAQGFATSFTRSQIVSYASSLKGKKKSELKTAIYNLCQAKSVLSYGSGSTSKTWYGFYQVDRYDTNKCRNRYSTATFTFSSSTAAISGMNIEHSFPKSWWGGSENNAYKDLFNLYPSASDANSSKSNYPMGKVTNASILDDYEKVGTGDAGGSTIRLCEPNDTWKGDFCRSYFYMATIYQNLTWTGSGSSTTGGGLQSLENDTWPTLREWAYTLYLEWTRNDRVTDIEVDRNNAIYGIQSNRNLFIDFPELAEYVWGDSVDVAFDPTTSLTSASDDKRFATYQAGNYESGASSGGDSGTDTDTGDSETASTGTITFGTSYTQISSSSVNGTDTNNNTWTITTVGTTSFTGNSAYYQVGSSSKPATSITFTTTLPSSANITSFSAKFGGFSGTAGTVTLKVGDTTVGTGSLSTTSDVTVSNSSTATGKVLTVTVTGISKGVKCYNISYTTSDETSTQQTPTFALGTYKTSMTVGDDADTYSVTTNSDGTLSATSSATGVATVSVSGTTVTVTPVAAGTTTITVSAAETTAYAAASKSYTLTVSAAAVTVSSIALSGSYSTSFTQGDEFSTDGMTVTATYSDGTTKDVTSSATFSGYDMSTTGNQTVKVSYTEDSKTVTATYSITVSASSDTADNTGVLFYESFDTNSGTGGNDDSWSGTIASSDIKSDNTGWTFTKGNGASKCAKFGSSSAAGSAQTPSITFTGTATITFKAAAWNGSTESTTLNISATNGTLSQSSVTLVKGEWTEYTITISGVTGSTQLTFSSSSSSKSRFFLDEVKVVTPTTSTSLPGDVDVDGDVDMDDLTLLSSYLIGTNTTTITEQGLKNAELSGDDTLNIVDLAKLIELLK